MFIPNLGSFKLSLVFLLIDFFKDILETTIIGLENGVFGTQVERHLAVKSNTETSMSKTFNGFIGIVHGHTNTTRLFKVENFPLFGLGAISRSIGNFKLTGTRSNKVSSTVL